MIELPKFPMRDQLHSIVPPSDGGPDENASFNCVPTCLAACIQWYTGKIVASDDLRDAIYGDKTIGGGAEVSYAGYVKVHYGLSLGYTPLPSASQAIIDHIRTELRLGHPTIVTMHSQWSRLWRQDAGDGLHVGVVYAISEDNRGVLALMNPWRGFAHVQPVSWWRDRLGIGVWPVRKIVPAAPTVVQPAGLPDWRDDGTTLVAPNKIPVRGGFREYVIERAAEGLWRGGMPYVSEYNDGADGSMQPFEAALLLWNPRQGVKEGSMSDALRIVAHEHQGKAA